MGITDTLFAAIPKGRQQTSNLLLDINNAIFNVNHESIDLCLWWLGQITKALICIYDDRVKFQIRVNFKFEALVISPDEFFAVDTGGPDDMQTCYTCFVTSIVEVIKLFILAYRN